MPQLNETSPYNCRFLVNEDFSLIHRKFTEAFSGYRLPFQMTEQQFLNHVRLNAVDLSRSVGCFDGSEMIGLSLNGFGVWDGVPTVYDAGTGVIPAYRRRGVSESMFRMMIPELKNQGYRQCVLEVIRENESALGLYRKLGFEHARTLLLMEAPEINIDHVPDASVELCDIEAPDLQQFAPFATGKPSWQNTLEAIERTPNTKRVIGAFCDGECVGFTVFYEGAGRLSQLAVRTGHRGRGIGSALLATMRDTTRSDMKPQVINIDSANIEAVRFFRNRGFGVLVEQLEMLKEF